MLKAFVKDDFANLLEYQEWIKERFANLSELNKSFSYRFTKDYVDRLIQRQPSWYGSTTYEEMERGITQFKDPELIERVYSQVNDKITTAVREKIKAKKILYNPNGLGVFIFDRAAMGMYRIKEFFSPSLDRVVEQEEVKQASRSYVLIKDGSPVRKRWEQRKEDGKPKIRTTSKNVYAYYPKISKERQAVELYLACGANSNINSEAFLYSGISAIIVAQILEKARIPNRISIAIGSSPDNFRSTAYACIIPVKEYDENLDVNLLALLSSEPRFFRYEGFKGVIGMYDYFKASCPSGLGNGMTRQYLSQVVERSTYTKNARLAPNRFYFGWTFSERDAVDTINDTIEEIAQRLMP
jgi:hypothetical protein